MVKSITLTASMRSNLNSLKNISKQMNTTQERLSTGKKVNSAIDNASSYYQARALTNRASDLDALLDAMGQGIQTIQAATQGLTSGVSFLEQASAIATEALAATKIPSKEYFETLVGENGAVVTTAQELKEALNSGKETICVYGKIDYSNNEVLTLKAGQKLVGTEYYTGYTGQDKFSKLTFSFTESIYGRLTCITMYDQSLVSDLDITCSDSSEKISPEVLAARKGSAEVQNVDIKISRASAGANGACGAAIKAEGATVNISGHNRIDVSGWYVTGTWAYNGGKINYLSSSTTEITVSATGGIYDGSCGVYTWSDAVTNVEQGARINIKVNKAQALSVLTNSVLDVAGNINAEGTWDIGGEYKDASFLYIGVGDYSGNQVNIRSSAKLNIKSKDSNRLFFVGSKNQNINKLIVEAGAQINNFDGETEKNLVSDGYQQTNETNRNIITTFNDLLQSGNFHLSTSQSDIDWDNIISPKESENLARVLADSAYAERYNKAFEQYDKLIEDSSYQGVNLLKKEKIDVIFNETRNNKLTVQGQDMSSETLGVTKAEWTTDVDIANSLSEIVAALNKIRTFQSELGNNYSIIQTRQNFTEALTDVLETGADNLVLADMNEESANYLALQTRQQLATNALSLAANSAQSVLALFG